MIYYFDPCGRITRRVQAPFHEASHLAQEGEQWVQSEEIYPDTAFFILNGAFTPFPEAPGPEWEWDWMELCWALPPQAFESSKAAKKASIDAERDRQRYSGVTYNGVCFDSDPVAAGNLAGWTAAVAAGIPVPAGFTWRSQDNRDIPFTSADILGLAAAMVAKTTACYQRAWQLKALVDQIADSADYARLESMDITAGWPI